MLVEDTEHNPMKGFRHLMVVPTALSCEYDVTKAFMGLPHDDIVLKSACGITREKGVTKPRWAESHGLAFLITDVECRHCKMTEAYQRAELEQFGLFTSI